MPTETPKERRESITTAVLDLSARDRKYVAIELLGYSSTEAAQDTLERLEFGLSHAQSRYRSADDRPQPDHLIAELQSIDKAAGELAALIHPQQLTCHARMMLPPIIDGLWCQLMELVNQANVTIASLKSPGSGGGDRERQYKREALEREKEALGDFFDGHAIDPDERDREEFLNFCLKKISA